MIKLVAIGIKSPYVKPIVTRRRISVWIFWAKPCPTRAEDQMNTPPPMIIALLKLAAIMPENRLAIINGIT